MATDDDTRRQVEELHARIAELTEALRSVTEERDAAYREIGRMRSERAMGAPASVEAKDDSGPRIEICAFCDGEGVYWVHDFEMQCKRCNGTGSVPKGSATTVPDRH